MLVKYACSGKVAKVTPMRGSPTPAVGKLMMDKPTRWSHALAVGKLLRDDSNYFPGGLHPPLGVFGLLLVSLFCKKKTKNCQNALFFPNFTLNSSAPWWWKKKADMSKVVSWSKLHSCQV